MSPAAKMPAHAGLEPRVYGHPTVERKACRFGQLEVRPHADARDEQVGRQPLSAVEHDRPIGDPGHLPPKVEHHAVLLVNAPDEVAQLGAHDALQRPLVLRHDLNLAAFSHGVTRLPRGR